MNKNLKNLYSKFSPDVGISLSADAKQRVKEKIFHRLAERAQVESVPTVSILGRIRTLMVKSYVLVPLVLVLFVISTAAASAHALPGDFLYPVKRQVESAQIALAPSPQAKLNLQVDFAQKRLQELEKVQAEAPAIKTDDQSASVVDNKPHFGHGNTATVHNSTSIISQTDAKAEAQKALDFLETAKKQLGQNGRRDNSQVIDKTINGLRDNLDKIGGDNSDSDRNHDTEDKNHH